MKRILTVLVLILAMSIPAMAAVEFNLTIKHEFCITRAEEGKEAVELFCTETEPEIVQSQPIPEEPTQ